MSSTLFIHSGQVFVDQLHDTTVKQTTEIRTRKIVTEPMRLFEGKTRGFLWVLQSSLDYLMETLPCTICKLLAYPCVGLLLLHDVYRIKLRAISEAMLTKLKCMSLNDYDRYG